MSTDTFDTTHPEFLAAATVEARAAPPVLVSSIDAVARSRLLTVGVNALLAEVAALLSSAQISLVVVCDASGVAVGVITRPILVTQLGEITSMTVAMQNPVASPLDRIGRFAFRHRAVI